MTENIKQNLGREFWEAAEAFTRFIKESNDVINAINNTPRGAPRAHFVQEVVEAAEAGIELAQESIDVVIAAGDLVKSWFNFSTKCSKCEKDFDSSQ